MIAVRSTAGNLSLGRGAVREILDGVRLRRLLTVVALTGIAATGLTACQTKVGLAASVDGTRLSDSQLSDYVRSGAKPYTDQNSGTTVYPKLQALETWIDSSLFDRAIARRGGAASADELSTARSVLLTNNTVGQVRRIYTRLGFTDKMGDLVIDSNATLVVLIQRIARGATAQQAVSALQGGQANQQIVSAINAAKPKVVVSSRYGKWDQANLRLSADPNSGLPSFVTGPGGSGSATALVPTPAP
jgi:hypothetical protein